MLTGAVLVWIMRRKRFWRAMHEFTLGIAETRRLKAAEGIPIPFSLLENLTPTDTYSLASHSLLNPFQFGFWTPHDAIKATNNHHVAKSSDHFSVFILILQQHLTPTSGFLKQFSLVFSYLLSFFVFSLFVCLFLLLSPSFQTTRCWSATGLVLSLLSAYIRSQANFTLSFKCHPYATNFLITFPVLISSLSSRLTCNCPFDSFMQKWSKLLKHL